MSLPYLLALLVAGALIFKVSQAIWRTQTIVRKRRARQLAAKQELAAFNQANPCRQLTAQQQHALAFAAPLFLHAQLPVTSLTAQCQFPYFSISWLKHWLADQWEINDTASACQVLEQKLSLEQSQRLDRLMHSQITRRQSVFNKMQQAQPELFSLAIFERSRSTYALDTCFAIGLARHCYWAGFLKQAEMWQYIERAVHIAQQLGIDWPDYACSILLGFEFAEIEDFDWFEPICMLLETNKNKPNTELEIDVWQRISFS